MSSRPKKEKVNRNCMSFILFFLILITLLFIYFLAQPLQTLSTEIQKKLSSKKEENEYLIKISLYLEKEITYLVFIIIIYNFGNIYQTFILFCSLMLSQLIISLSIIFISFSYFLYKGNFLSSIVSSSYTIKFKLFIFYLIYWKILFQSKNIKGCCIKFLSLLIILPIIILLFLLKFFIDKITLEKIFFSFLIGFCYYFFLFYVLYIDCNNPTQLIYITKLFSRARIILLYLIINGFFILLIILNKFIEIMKILIVVSSVLTAILGLKIEYFLFEGKIKNWSKYNFEGDFEGSDEEDLVSKISITKPLKWNNTSFIKSIFRFLVCLLLLIPLIIFLKINDGLEKENLQRDILIKFFFGINLISFGLFFLLKIILKSLKLTNLTHYFLIRESM